MLARRISDQRNLFVSCSEILLFVERMIQLKTAWPPTRNWCGTMALPWNQCARMLLSKREIVRSTGLLTAWGVCGGAPHSLVLPWMLWLISPRQLFHKIKETRWTSSHAGSRPLPFFLRHVCLPWELH